MSTKHTGNTGEGIACTFLERKGFLIRDRNYRKPWGEIDIIAEREGVVRFVEVKSVSRETLPDISPRHLRGSRDTNDYRPEEQVHPAKLQRIVRTAETYMAEIGEDKEFQVDVVAVFLDHKRRKARCRLLENVL